MADERIKHRVLFLCNQNRLRSPTAERVFCEEPGLDVRSAGIDRDAAVPLTRELVEWAETVFVMEKRQRNFIRGKFPDLYQAKRIICLYIPDDHEFMDPELIQILKARVAPHL